MTDLTGRVIKGYELRVKLGAGGFGAVYQAHQAVVEREVAIKVILPQHANHPEFIRRFETEAQLVARLEHLHIVPLHDYWRDPDGAYLVMRWLQGGSLRGKLNEQSRLDVNMVAGVYDQIGDALAVAHRRKVVHRDLKPDNILLDEENNAYLADFGIAKDIAAPSDTSDGEFIVGSPAYLSPEQILGQPVSPATDIYSMGIMLYELLTGAAPFLGSTATDLLKYHLYEPIPPASAARPDLPEDVDLVIKKATQKTPAERYQDARSLTVDFRKAIQTMPGVEPGSGQQTPAAPASDYAAKTPKHISSDSDEVATYVSSALGKSVIQQVVPGWGIDNPYKGLRAFQEADSEDFFGRETLVEQLLARLCEDGEAGRFLAVVGPSGSGKSSLVRAGLIPALRQGKIPDSQYWFVADMIPGPHPFEELEAALLQVAVNATADLSEQLTRDPGGLLGLIDQILPDDEDTDLVLLIDQFEELFTLVENEAERTLFLDSLLKAVTAPDSRLHLILTLRADFYDRPLMYPAFGDLIRRHTEVVLPLTGAALEQVIVKPAEQIGIKFESGLLDAILQDIGEQPGALPLLQYALTELFERRRGSILTLDAYRETGGVLGALARRADELYRELDPDSQEAVQQLFLRLINLGEGTEYTRRRIQQTELPVVKNTPRLMNDVVDRFAKFRLLTLDRDPILRRPTVEVAHEALIRTWGPLKGWLESNRDDLQMQRRVEAAAAEWVNMGEESSYLASGARLEQFEHWAKKTKLSLNPIEQRYLQTSLDEQAARKATDEARKARELKIAQRATTFGRAAAVLAVVGVLAVIATLAAISSSAEAQNQVFVAGETLTPVPPTLTAVQVALDQGNSQLATATNAEGKARIEAQGAQTEVEHANRTLTPIVQQIAAQRKNLEALSLASDAVRELSSTRGNPEVAALLAIRSMRLTYDPLADSALMQSLDQMYTLRRFVHQEYVTSVKFSPDGKLIATGCADHIARLWDVATGQEVQKFAGHTDSVVSVAFSPDGKTLLTGGKDFTARLWDISTGKEIRQFAGHSGVVRSAVFSPDGSQVLTGSEDMTARLWDASTGKELQQFVGHTGVIYSVAFSPDGQKALTGSWDLSARLWDVNTGKEIQKFVGHTNYVWSVAFSPDGNTVLTGSVDYTARLWDVNTGKELQRYAGHNDAIWAVAFSPDGNTILTASIDFTARLWDRVSGFELRRFRGHTDVIAGAAFSPDGKTIVTVSRDQTARLWAVNPGPEARQFNGHTNAVSTVAYSRDAKTVLTSSYDGTVWLWDAATYQPIRQLVGNSREITAAAFSPDGKTVLTGSADQTARLWDVATGKELVHFTGHTGIVSSVAFSPDGKIALTGSYDGTAQLWDTTTGQVLNGFVIPNDAVVSVAFSPDGKHALLGSLGSTVWFVDVTTAQVVYQLKGHTSSVNAVVFSPDGKLAASGSLDRTVILWDVATGTALQQLVGHTDGIMSLAFMPDGKQILSGSSDHTIRLWDVATGKEVRQFVGHTSAVLSLSVAPDGKHFLSASTDQTVRLWDTTYQDFMRFACSRLVRDLTTEEREKFDIADQEPTCRSIP